MRENLPSSAADELEYQQGSWEGAWETWRHVSSRQLCQVSCGISPVVQGMAALAATPSIPAEVRLGYTTVFSLLTCLSAATKTSLAIWFQKACILHKEEDSNWASRSGQTLLQQGRAPLRRVIPISRILLIYSAEQSPASRRRGRQGAWERPAFLSPLSHLSLTKVVKCFPVHLLSHRYLHSVSQEDKSGEVCLPRLPPPPPLQQPWEQNTLPSHRQPEFVSLLRREDQRATLFDYAISDTRAKERGQGNGKRGDKQGGREVQRKATQNNHQELSCCLVSSWEKMNFSGDIFISKTSRPPSENPETFPLAWKKPLYSCSQNHFSFKLWKEKTVLLKFRLQFSASLVGRVRLIFYRCQERKREV